MGTHSPPLRGSWGLYLNRLRPTHTLYQEWMHKSSSSVWGLGLSTNILLTLSKE